MECTSHLLGLYCIQIDWKYWIGSSWANLKYIIMFLGLGSYQARYINSMKIDEVAAWGKLPLVNQSFWKLSLNPSDQHILCNPSYCAPVLVGKQSIVVNQPSACGLFLLYLARSLVLRPSYPTPQLKQTPAPSQK